MGEFSTIEEAKLAIYRASNIELQVMLTCKSSTQDETQKKLNTLSNGIKYANKSVADWNHLSAILDQELLESAHHKKLKSIKKAFTTLAKADPPQEM
jgi:hypothetical protein